MTSPDKPIPENTWTAADIAQLQNIDTDQYTADYNADTYDQAELVRQTFFTVIYSTVEQIPIIGGMIGDVIEIITGVEDGDLNDLATWVNNIGDLVNSFIAAALHALADLLDMVPFVGDDLASILDGIADGINGTNATAVTAKSAAETAKTSAATAQTTADTAASNASTAVSAASAAANAAANAGQKADAAYSLAVEWSREFLVAPAEVQRGTNQLLVGPMLAVRNGRVAIMTDVYIALLEQHNGATIETRKWDATNTSYTTAHIAQIGANETRRSYSALTVNVEDEERFFGYVSDILGTIPPTVLQICVSGVYIDAP